MYKKHQNNVKGDFSFIENLLPKSVKIHHMDSYNIDSEPRFQGAFYYVFGDREVICNDCPLEILKLAKRYQTSICQCIDNTTHTTWTIWF